MSQVRKTACKSAHFFFKGQRVFACGILSLGKLKSSVFSTNKLAVLFFSNFRPKRRFRFTHKSQFLFHPKKSFFCFTPKKFFPPQKAFCFPQTFFPNRNFFFFTPFFSSNSFLSSKKTIFFPPNKFSKAPPFRHAGDGHVVRRKGDLGLEAQKSLGERKKFFFFFFFSVFIFLFKSGLV